MPHWLKRSELCLESKELQLLPYSWLSGGPSGVLVEALLPGGGAPWHQVARHLLKMRKV